MSEKLSPKQIRLKVIGLIEAGNATIDTILKELGEEVLKDKRALSRVFGELRIMDKFPIVGDDGFYVLMEEEEYEKYMAGVKKAKAEEAKKPKLKLGAQKRRRTAVARKVKALETFNKATAIATKSDDMLDKLKAQKANIDLSIADLQLKRLKVDLVEQLGLKNLEELDSIKDLDDYVTSLKEAAEATG